MKARMPFKYGIATLTALPHLFVRLEVLIDGKPYIGIASDGLAPKWFTKNPESSFEEDIDEMLYVISTAVKFAEDIHESKTVFSFWKELHDKQSAWGKSKKLPPLLSALGTSLIERALISAFCTAKGLPFHEALKGSSLGFNLNEIYPHLDCSILYKCLPKNPQNSIAIRHTVGLADALYESDIKPDEKVNDGLPQSFEENIKVYGINKLKIKLFGKVEADTSRLLKIRQIMKDRDYEFTLDGNEFFKSAAEFKDYWSELSQQNGLQLLLKKMLFVEQAIHRDFALSEESTQCFLNWQNKPPIIIDESDGELDSAHTAIKLGYAGTSHKNCKGIFKSVANACLMKVNSGILSAEDLCNIGPVALQQDLAVASALGIQHVERNGHQYMRGLSMFPKEIQTIILSDHSDLYKEHKGYPSLKVCEGMISLKSVNSSPFGVQKLIDSRQFTPLNKWQFKSLNF